MVKSNELPTTSIRLKELRKRRKLTQKEVSDKIGIDLKSYGNHERGVVLPNMDIIIKYADFYGCSVDYLLGRNNYTSIDNCNIANITGLSDKAINVLKRYKRDDEKIKNENPFQSMDVLNFLITYKDFDTFLQNFYGASKYYYKGYDEIDLQHRDYKISTSVMPLNGKIFEEAWFSICKRNVETMILAHRNVKK